MNWLENLKTFKEKSGKTHKDISKKTGIPQTTIEKLFSGRTADPKLNTIKAIVESMGYTISQLVGEDIAPDPKDKLVFDRYLSLDAPGRNIVRFVINHEYERMKDTEVIRPKTSFHSIYYDFPVSAGTGEYMDMTNTKMIETEEKPPSGTSYIIRIAGDSMEPEFFNHDLVYVEKCSSIEYGETGIFICAGNVYMKEYTKKGLRSLNPKYAVIPPSNDMQCLGRVLGTVSGRVNIV